MEDKTQQQRQYQQGKGRLVIRVFGSDAKDPGLVVRDAQVTATLGDIKVTGTTGNSGELILEVDPGTWKAEVDAFGLIAHEDVRVQAKCEADVDLMLCINPLIVISAVGPAGRPGLNYYPAGTVVEAYVQSGLKESDLTGVTFEWGLTAGNMIGEGRVIHIDTSAVQGQVGIQVTMTDANGARLSTSAAFVVTGAPTVPVSGTLNLGLRRSAGVVTPDLPLWAVIRNSTEGLSFKRYQDFVDAVLCNGDFPGLAKSVNAKAKGEFGRLRTQRFLPFTDVDAYRLLKVATEAFVMVNCGVALTSYPPFDPDDFELLIGRTGVTNLGKEYFDRLWRDYLVEVNGTSVLTLPYLAQIASKFPDACTKSPVFSALAASGAAPSGAAPEVCQTVLRQKLSEPCLVELIWSYWHEEAMLVQTMNAISSRFQNRMTGRGDPLANMEIAPLRPLNNLLWGYVQDEQHRLTVWRRGHEYDHEYGLRLEGRAVDHGRTADSRAQFLPAFHNLLHQCSLFFPRDDNATIIADAFPVLNTLKEVHLILSQGAHNQFGDLPVTARIEMLMQQWLLARPEFAEFLPSRAMVSYPEPWMDRVDAMKKLQGWSDVSVLHFRDLAIFGERLLLTIRHGSWVDVSDPDRAKNWLRVWRPEIQGYIHAYRAVTGVDLTAEPVNSSLPSVLLRQRLAQQPRLSRAYGGR